MTEEAARTSRSAFVSLALLVASMALFPVQAQAARYDVHACRVPNGTAVPASGWDTTTATLGGRAAVAIDCPGTGMSVRPTGGPFARDESLYGFEFGAPPGTTIAGWRRVTDGDMKTNPGTPPPWEWEVGEFGNPAIGAGDRIPTDLVCGNCGAFHADWDLPDSIYPLSRLFVAMRCYPRGSQSCQANGAHFTLRSIAVHLDDTQPPQILGASGDLLDGASNAGLRHLSLDLRDVGGGLYKVRIDVDGKVFSEQAVDENQGACKPPFVQPVPCKLAAKLEVPVDTTRLTPGPHSVAVRVFDATGVNSAVYGPVAIDVDDATRLRCPADADGVLTRRVRRPLVRFGGRTWLTGRARGAVAARGSRVRLLGSQSTGTSLGKRGGFRLKVRPARTSHLTPVLVDKSGAALICGKPLRVRVRAGARLRVAPRHLRNGESIRLRGEVRGRPLPAGGKTVVIQARARGSAGWSTVTVLRSDARAHFQFRYRFRRTFRATTYEFRALIPKQRGYPYARGWSRAKRATVRP